MSSDRRHRVVLDPTSNGGGPIDAGQTGHEMQGHVDAGTHAGAGDDVAVVDVPGLDVGVDGGVDLREQVEPGPMGRGAPTGQQAGGCVDQASGAHRCHQGNGVALRAHPSQMVGIVQQPTGTDPARMDQDVEPGRVLDRAVRAEREPFRAGDGHSPGGETRDVPAVVGELLGPVGQDLPGSDRVELFHAVKQQQSDVIHRSSLARAGLAHPGQRAGVQPNGTPAPRYVPCMVVGRERELAALAELVDAGRRGSAGVLLLSGEPGVGKSTLLDELVDTTANATVLRAQGLEVEAPLAFAALHRFLRPLDRLRATLPEPQARALRMAFGEEDGPAVEPFLVGVATLGLLTAAAEERLVLCIVDDAQWLDPASADALLFCARRIAADRAVMVFASRDDAARELKVQGLPEMTVNGLEPEAARVLLDDRFGSDRSDQVTERLITETGGNPLALTELPTALSVDQLQGNAPLPAQFHLSERVERVFLDRFRNLPASVQALLLLFAADDSGEHELVSAALAQLGLHENDVETALHSRLLVTRNNSISLRHPLMRSAVYQASTREERRRAHLALAAAAAALGDSDREAWQRAAAADGPDLELASALSLVGSRAQRAGAHLSAMAAYERAAALCPDPEQRASLAFQAARGAWSGGRAAAARGLLKTATASAEDPALTADIARLRGHLEVNLGSATVAHRIFVEAARAVLPTDPVRALELGVLAAIMRTYGADSGTTLRSPDLVDHDTLDTAPRTRCLAQLLVAMTRTADQDLAGAVEALDRAAAIGLEVADREALWNIGNAALQLGADQTHRQFYSLALSRAREAGAITAVIYALERLCFSHYVAGDVVAVRSSADEALSLAESVGQPGMTSLPLAWLALLAALQDRDDYDELVRRLEEIVPGHALGILADPVHDLTRWAKGIRAASTGDRSAALHHLSRFRLPVLERMAAIDRIDAAVRAEEPDLARRWVEELAGFAEATGRPWALAAVAYGRAVVDDSPDAETWFDEALSHYGSAGRPLDEARAELAYGEWLRRTQRRVDARTHLRRALETFQDAHAAGLSERASQELRASGETARKRDPSTLVNLTPMELKVAELVRSGLSNKDVAAQIWVSPRTVAFHLRNIFTKAGVTSRGELAQLDLT